MANITDYLYRLQDLTNTNLKILTAINDAFSTKKEHLSVMIGTKRYIIPSYIALENKVDQLQADFENLVSIPKTGEAAITFDENTQKIRLLGYSNCPEGQKIDPVTTFYAEKTDIFKDFMTPAPYVKLNLSNLASNAAWVNVKKVSIKNANMVAAVQEMQKDGVMKYEDMAHILYNYEEDKDYTEYDTLRRLPLKDNTPYGTYSVRQVKQQWIDENFEEHYSLELNEDLTYTAQNQSVEFDIEVGDYLVTNDDTIKLLVESIEPAVRTLQVKVLYGAYAEIHDITQGQDHCKLRYYKQRDYSQFKYINVPLEEDQHVCIFVAALNDEMNIQAPWGEGIYINTDDITINLNGEIVNFKEYYTNYVNNVGDTLYGLTDMVRNTVNNIHKDEFDRILASKPVLEKKNFDVVQINKHLDDADTIQNIRKLYSQKSQYKTDLQGVLSSITNITKMLSSISFDDTENNRQLYESQLTEWNAKKIELNNSIAAVSQEIAQAANDTELPIDGAKYHIRGFVEENPEGLPKPIRIDCEYRYKNKSRYSGNATTIDSKIFSDWNRMYSFVDMRHPTTDGFTFFYKYDENTSVKNEPSWNQIDIPISQGEIVDFRVRYIYDLGWPFIETASQWSDIQQMEFPEKYVKKVSILDIINENNNDIKEYQFESLLLEKGIPTHVEDKIQDNDVTYFHKPEHISSGFYTEERRIIPLKDKLTMIDSSIHDLQSEIYGLTSQNLIVTLSDNMEAQTLMPYIDNHFECTDYSSNEHKADNKIFKDISSLNSSEKQREIGYTQLDLSIYNAGEYPAKFYTMFPGAYTQVLKTTARSKFDAEDYVFDTTNAAGEPLEGVWMQVDTGEKSILQHHNQWMYWRVRSIYDFEPYYERATNTNLSVTNSPKLLAVKEVVPEQWVSTTNVTTFNSYVTIYPYIGDLTAICIDANDQYKVLNPGESVTIPLAVYYYFNNNASNEHLERTMSFDLRTSLYTDPINYTFTVGVSNTSNVYKKVKKETAMKQVSKTPYQSVVVRQVDTQTKARRGNSGISVVNQNKKRR